MSAKNNLPIHPDLRNALALLGDIPADAVTAADCWNAVAPKCPPGKTYARWSFWGILNVAVIIRKRRVERVVKYIHDWQRRGGKAGDFWPPKALFAPVRAMPQPDERK